MRFSDDVVTYIVNNMNLPPVERDLAADLQEARQQLRERDAEIARLVTVNDGNVETFDDGIEAAAKVAAYSGVIGLADAIRALKRDKGASDGKS